MKLSVKKLLVLLYLFHAPVLVGMMHEMEPVDIAGYHLDGSEYEPVDGSKAHDPAVIDAASSTHDGYIDQGQGDQVDLLRPVEAGEEPVMSEDVLAGPASSSTQASVVDQRPSLLDGFDDVSLDDEPAGPVDQRAPKTTVQKFVDAVKKLWNDFWNKLTGRKLQVTTSGGVEKVSPGVTDVEPLTVDQKTQLRNLALQDPSNFAAATAQVIAEGVGQAAKELRDAEGSTDPKVHEKALSYVEVAYEPLQLVSKTLRDLNVYTSNPRQFDFGLQAKVISDHLSEHTFFPSDSAGQRDLYTRLGKEVLQPRDGVYRTNSKASELAYAYRRNQAQKMLADNPAWQTALNVTKGSMLGVDAQGNVVVRTASGEEQPLTDTQYASLGEAYAQQLPDVSLNQEQLLYLARAKMAASGTPVDVVEALQQFVQCVGNDFYYGDLLTFQKTGQKPAGNSSLRAPDISDLTRVATARQSLETDYQQAKSSVAGA